MHFIVLQATEGRYNNKGAYILLKPPHFDTPEFHSFEAVTPRPKVQITMHFESVDLVKLGYVLLHFGIF